MTNDDSKETLKETVVADFKVMSWHLLGIKGGSKVVLVLS
jgi:hypothetical protein